MTQDQQAEVDQEQEDEYTAPPEYQAHVLAQQYAPLTQKVAAMQIELSYRNALLAQKDEQIAALTQAAAEHVCAPSADATEDGELA